MTISTEDKREGEGIYEYVLADGSTRFRVLYRKSDSSQGQRRGFTSRREARRWRAEISTRAARGEVKPTPKATFAELFDNWLERRKPYLEPGTWRDYEVHGRRRIKPFFGAMKATAIERDTVERWLAGLTDTGLAAKTINNALGVLVTCLNDAVERDVLARNPALLVERLPSAHREMDYLRLAEIPRYLDGCADYYRPLAELLIATGLRISEALALRWSDVDFERQIVLVHRSRKKAGIGSTKGDRFRQVNIGPRLAEMLKDVRGRQAERHTADASRQLVFRGPRGGELSRSDVSRDLHKEALRAAGLRTSLRLHDLRHTAAATWLQCNLPLIYVQRQLGHASIQTTERQYGHLESDWLADAAARVEQHVWRSAPRSRQHPTRSNNLETGLDQAVI
jgi:integrase